MKRLFFLLTILFYPVVVVAQFDGLGDIGGGNYNNTGGNNYTGGNSNTSGSAAPSTGMATDPTALESAGDLAVFQGFTTPGSSQFIGVPNATTFVGVEQFFDESTSKSSRRTTTSTASTARRTTTTSRMTTSRMNTMGMTSRSMGNNQRNVRSTASSEFDFSPLEVDTRSVALQTRITKLPSLRGTTDQVAVRMDGNTVTLTGTVATSHERKLAEQLVRLEPGVDTVDNRLSVKE